METVFIGAVVAAFGGALFVTGWEFFFSTDAKARRRLRKAAAGTIAEAHDGEVVKLVGTLHYVDRAPSIAPMSKRSCAAYELQVEEKQSSGRSSSWVTVLSDKSCAAFWIEDASGKAFVDAVAPRVVVTMDAHRKSGFLNDAPRELERLLASHGLSSEGWVFNKTLRYSEGVLEEGEAVAVLGRCHWELDPDPTASGVGYRDRPQRLVIRAPEPAEMLVTDEVRLL
ncbi:MAG: hypothetical protein JRH20_15280 [Deltaproteobacteria bacterium]|nr:hypothetical protein [Deltaproteobacteria bacterium]